jgi:hypothetical protein
LAHVPRLREASSELTSLLADETNSSQD